MTAVAARPAAQPSSPQSSPSAPGPSASSPSTRKSASAAALRWRTPMLFLAPFLLLFLGMYVLPILFAIGQSLFTLKRDGLGLTAPSLNFEPLANYARVFADTEFTASLGRVLLFGVVQVPLMLGVALLLALLIDSKSARAKGFFRLSSFLPFAVPGVVAAVMWSFLYSPVTSPINGFLENTFGFSIPFFSDGLALWSVANVVTWCWTGYNMLIIYSALQTIPAETLEAAKLDGASAVRMAWSIKIPMVRPAIILTTVFSIIGSAQLFNEPTVLKSISGGAITSTFTPLMAAQASVAAQNYPYAAAQSVVLAVLVGVLSWAFFRITSQGDDA